MQMCWSRDKLKPYLGLTIDYGWLWMIAKPLFWVLYQLHQILGNWGWSIILLTVFIKAAFFQLSAKSYTSMANMRKLQPEMLRLKELYGDDRQKMSQETLGHRFSFLGISWQVTSTQNGPWRSQLPPNWSLVVPGCSLGVPGSFKITENTWEKWKNKVETCQSRFFKDVHRQIIEIGLVEILSA